MKKDLSVFVIIAGLFISVLIVGNQIVKKNRIIHEKSESITNLLTENKQYKRTSGKQAMIIRIITVSANELKNSNDTLLDVIDDLKIRLKDVTSISQTVTQTNLNLQLPLHDSTIIVYDTIHKQYVTDTLKTFEFEDEYIDVIGVIDLRNDSALLAYDSWDKTTIVLNKEKRRHWWKIWKKRKLVQTITNENPRNTIVYSRYVEISK
ncbi:MAG: hypothetical protein PF448_06385 [Bacteroidales bacterium]|jgi:hypothetical protein|nr:hypothetical protein [Bacteroidales bacterium]